ncbi:MAG: hypothetical protein ABSC05_29925 [Candidatus Solibacter sp.]
MVYASYGNGTAKGGGLCALDLKTGKPLWNFATPSSQGERSSPVCRGRRSLHGQLGRQSVRC